MRVSRRFISAIATQIGPDSDIPAPDVGTNAQVMAWFSDTYQNIAGPNNRHDSLRVVTGKPIEMGGSLGREKATGQGALFALQHWVDEQGFTLNGLTAYAQAYILGGAGIELCNGLSLTLGGW